MFFWGVEGWEVGGDRVGGKTVFQDLRSTGKNIGCSIYFLEYLSKFALIRILLLTFRYEMIVKNFYKMKTSRKGKVELETDSNRVINKRNSFCITGLVVLIPINKTKNVLYSNELIYCKLKGALIQLCSSLAC